MSSTQPEQAPGAAADAPTDSATLRASEQKYRKMVERANDAIFAVDTVNGLIVEANPKAEALTGYSQAELRGMHVWELHPEDERASATALFERVRSHGHGVYEDVHFLRKDGALLAVDVSASVITYGDKTVIQRICRDVTDRRRRERELRFHRALEELVLDVSTRFVRVEGCDVIAAMDGSLARLGEVAMADRAYVYVLSDNGRQGHVYVWSAPEVPCFTPGPHAVDLSGFEWALERLRRDETVIWQVEDDIAGVPDHVCPPGARHVPRASVCVPMRIRSAAGEATLCGFVGFDRIEQPESTWREATLKLLRVIGHIFAGAIERKQAREALERANDELEAKVRERTSELEQKQAELVQSQKMAALGQLVAGVAHEVNTPLGALKSNNQTLASSLDKLERLVAPEAASEPAADASGSARGRGAARVERVISVARGATETATLAVAQIERIVTNLRSFARLDRAELDLFDLREGLDSALDLLVAELGEQRRVVRRYEDVPAVSCHAGQINQVFMSLLLNAVQSIDGPGEITVSTRAATDRVVVEIADSGRGIAPADLERVFEPGYSTKTGLGVGTGFGLSIAHRVVTHHGGSIALDSEVGRGTRVTISLPLDHAPHD